MKAFDPRRVEPAFRKTAYVAMGIFLGLMIPYIFRQAWLIWTGPDYVETAREANWGKFPLIVVCSGGGFNPLLLNYSVTSSVKTFDNGMPNANPWNIVGLARSDRNYNLGNVTRQCAEFNTSSLALEDLLEARRHHQPYVSLRFRISFQPVRPPRPPGGSEERWKTSLRVELCENFENCVQDYQIGGYVPAYLKTEITQWDSELKIDKEKVQHVDGSETHRFTARSNANIMHKPQLPQTPFLQSPLVHMVPENGQESAVRMATFTITKELPKGYLPSIGVVKFVSKQSRLLKFIAQLGGYLTILRYLWGCLFPHKYPRSNVVITYDERTLLGHASREYDVHLPRSEVDAFGRHIELGLWDSK